MSKNTIKKRLEQIENQASPKKLPLFIICEDFDGVKTYTGDCWTEEDRRIARGLSEEEYQSWLKSIGDDANRICFIHVSEHRPPKTEV